MIVEGHRCGTVVVWPPGEVAVLVRDGVSELCAALRDASNGEEFR
ncbi:MAG: hypothetical protein ACREX8_07045 [Gammaproteobacteria bacterium]